jgi:hypothetical protein
MDIAIVFAFMLSEVGVAALAGLAVQPLLYHTVTITLLHDNHYSITPYSITP